jgi:hypothetical protein
MVVHAGKAPPLPWWERAVVRGREPKGGVAKNKIWGIVKMFYL